MLLQRIDDQSNQLVNKVGGRRLTGIEYSVQHFPVPNQSLEGSRQSSVLQGIVCISFETGCLRCKTMHAKKLCIVCNKLCHYLVCLWYSADIHILAHTRVTLFYIPAPTEGIQEYWTLKTDRKGSKNAWRPRPYVVQSRENWSGWTTFRCQKWSDPGPLLVAISGPGFFKNLFRKQLSLPCVYSSAYLMAIVNDKKLCVCVCGGGGAIDLKNLNKSSKIWMCMWDIIVWLPKIWRGLEPFLPYYSLVSICMSIWKPQKWRVHTNV